MTVLLLIMHNISESFFGLFVCSRDSCFGFVYVFQIMHKISELTVTKDKDSKARRMLVSPRLISRFSLYVP